MLETLLKYLIIERIMENKKIPKILKCSVWLIMGFPLIILGIWCIFFESYNTREQWIFCVFTIVMLYVFIRLTIETWKRY